jgi:hypothetical protein
MYRCIHIYVCFLIRQREPHDCDSLPPQQFASEQILKFNQTASRHQVRLQVSPQDQTSSNYRVPEPWVITGGALGSGTNAATRVWSDAVVDSRGAVDWLMMPQVTAVVRAQQTIFKTELIIQ